MGRVTVYLRGARYWIYYRRDTVIRRPVGTDRDDALALAARINAELSAGSTTSLEYRPVALESLVHDWLDHHEFIKRSSLATIRRYRTAVQHLLDFAAKTSSASRCDRLTPATAEAFVRYLRQVKIAPNGHANSTKRTMRDKGVSFVLAAGPTSIRVVPCPRVAVLTTGAELLDPEAELEPGRIRDSNGPMLRALVQSAGLSCRPAQRVSDSIAATAEALKSASDQAELIVTNGGVSVGDYDLVPRAIEQLGGELLFHRVAIRPGKPTLIARLGAAWIVGLPGNPVSAFVGWHLFGRALAKRLSGDPQAWIPRTMIARLAAQTGNRGARTVLAPAKLLYDGGSWLASPLAWKGSHDIVALARANALLEIQPGQQFAPGAMVTCRILDS